MSVTTKRQLPNVNYGNMRQLNNNISSPQRNKGGHFNHNGNEHSSLLNEYGKVKRENNKISDRNLNDSVVLSNNEEIVRSRFDRRLQEIEREIRRNREEQHNLTRSIYDEEDHISQARAEPNKQKFEIEINKNSFPQPNSTALLDCAKSIRENVTQFKNQLMRGELKHQKQMQQNEELSSILRRRGPEQDYRQLENEYLIQQKTKLSKTTTLNEMVKFKNELEKSEQQREQLSDRLESFIQTSDEKEKSLSKTLSHLKELTETCDTFERQNSKLQNDLTLALEKLEEMTQEAERFAQESLHSQKQLADSEQKREESQIQSQETVKQWNGRVKKLEKDIDRYKLDSTQILEKNEQLIKEINTLKSQNSTLKEQVTQNDTDLIQANAKYDRLDDQLKLSENDIIQLRTIRSSQEAEITTLRRTINELENQLSIQRQRFSQTDKDKQNLQQLLQEESNHRNNLHLKLKQSEQDIETINTSRTQFQQQIIEGENQRMDLSKQIREIQSERDLLLKEKSKFNLIENDYQETKSKLEATKVDYTRGMKALQMDYENKIEIFHLQLSDEQARVTILQRHELEHRKEIERLQDKSAKYEDETTQRQCTIEALSREINDKSRLINDLESKITKLTVETANQKNQTIKKDQDYRNSLQTFYNDIIYCTECLSNESNKPFIIESTPSSRDDIEVWSSRFNAHLAWLKQELEIRQQQENKLRQDLNNALLDCEADRTYFASELGKREVIINELTSNHQGFKREYSDSINEQPRFDIHVDYHKQQVLTEDKRAHINDRYHQLQIMIDSVKRELHTAKVQLSA